MHEVQVFSNFVLYCQEKSQKIFKKNGNFLSEKPDLHCVHASEKLHKTAFERPIERTFSEHKDAFLRQKVYFKVGLNFFLPNREACSSVLRNPVLYNLVDF